MAIYFNYKENKKRPIGKKISAIVPVFNEEKTITNVVKKLLKSHLIDEVICINDGSTDKSLEHLKKFKNKIKLISFDKNQGKGYALVEGIKKANEPIVVFIDADLTNLSQKHIETLLKPILNNKFRAVLGYPSNGKIPNIFSNLTGERVYYKDDLLPHLSKMAKTRFGVEIFLNDIFDAKETKKVPLKKLKGLYKSEKRDSINTFREYINEAVEIAQEIGKKEKLLPEDYQIISQISKVTNIDELKVKIKKIANRDVKQFFERYVLAYIKIAQNWLNKPN